MNKYTIGAIILVAIGLMGISSYSSDKSSTGGEKVTSVISVTGDKHDFGEIDIFGGKVQTTYTLKNEGAEDVTITSALTSCMCTEGEIAGYRFGMHGSDVRSVTIPAGGEEEVVAIYDPLAHGPNGTGKVTRELLLKTNSTKSPLVKLRFSGDVVKNETD